MMLRFGYPLVLLAALAAGRARAQDGDRYGPRPVSYAASAPAPDRAVAGTRAPPPLRTAAPMLRSLSWPGKAELRPALAPVEEASAPLLPSPAAYAPRSAAASVGRFPSMAAYTAPVPAPALRPAARAYADVPYRSTAWPPPARTARRQQVRPTTAAAAALPQPVPAPPPASPAADERTAPQAGWSNLPQGLAAPPAYVPPGPAYGPALAAQAHSQAQAAAAATADTLPPATVGRYGYVGPGRTASGAAAPAPPPTPTPSVQPAAAGGGGLGPPRPPVYARGYVLPAQAPANGASPSSPAAPGGGGDMARTSDGSRRYSVHREYGMEPDPMPVPPQFFAATPDLSAPETEPAAPRNSKAAVNAARLAATGG